MTTKEKMKLLADRYFLIAPPTALLSFLFYLKWSQVAGLLMLALFFGLSITKLLDLRRSEGSGS